MELAEMTPGVARCLAGLLVLLAGCEAPPTNVAEVVVVRADDHFVTGSGIVERAGLLADLEAWQVTADGARQLPVTVAGQVAVIPRTTLSVLELHYRGIWFTADAANIDLGADRLGRPDAEAPNATSAVALSIGKLAPWQSGDQVELYSAGAGAWMLEALSADDGATELQALLPWKANLVRASAGDRLLVAQLDSAMLDGKPYFAVARAIDLSTVEMSGGQLPVQAAMAEVPREQFAVDWRISAFDDQRLRTQPVIANAWYDAELAAMPAGDSLGNYDRSADLVTMEISDQIGRDLSGSFDYGRPTPDDWPVVATLVAWYPLARRIVDSDGKALLFDGVWIRDLAGALDGVPLRPTLGAPEQLRVNGADATVSRTGIGLSPRISWDRPALGDPTGYVVIIYSLASVDGQTLDIGEVELHTTRTEVRLPPGAVDPKAGGYVVQVWSVSVPRDLAARPLSVGLPQAQASVTSETLIP